jgi:hypothetical protein
MSEVVRKRPTSAERTRAYRARRACGSTLIRLNIAASGADALVACHLLPCSFLVARLPNFPGLLLQALGHRLHLRRGLASTDEPDGFQSGPAGGPEFGFRESSASSDLRPVSTSRHRDSVAAAHLANSGVADSELSRNLRHRTGPNLVE